MPRQFTRLHLAAFLLLALALLLRIAAGVPSTLVGSGLGAIAVGSVSDAQDHSARAVSMTPQVEWSVAGLGAEAVAHACEAHKAGSAAHKHCVACWFGASVNLHQSSALPWLQMASSAPATLLWLWWPTVFLDGPLRPPMSCAH